HQHQSIRTIIDRSQGSSYRRAAPRRVLRILNDLNGSKVHRGTNLLAGRTKCHEQLIELAGSRVQQGGPPVGEELFGLPEATRGTGSQNQTRDEQPRLPDLRVRRMVSQVTVA